MRTMPLRLGCVPYLNAKPLVDWFHSPEGCGAAEVSYAVPSRLAELLRNGAVDAALVSIFELFVNPALTLVPGISISANGPVQSVRLFSSVPFGAIRSVALDSSSLTSAALVRILLEELHGVKPLYAPHGPDLDEMLRRADAALLIGDLKLFDMPAAYVMDLGEAWLQLTGRPFVYAAWLAAGKETAAHARPLLEQARDWGLSRLPALAARWSQAMALPRPRVEEYLSRIMLYDLDAAKQEALAHFRDLCRTHGLLETPAAAAASRPTPS